MLLCHNIELFFELMYFEFDIFLFFEVYMFLYISTGTEVRPGQLFCVLL